MENEEKWKREGGKWGKIEKKKEKKGKEENQKYKGKKDGEKAFFFFFFFFAFHFHWNHWNFFGSTKMEISTGKKLKSHRENIGKNDFAPPPSEKFPCYAPVYR